jgi:hypothetical protein
MVIFVFHDFEKILSPCRKSSMASAKTGFLFELWGLILYDHWDIDRREKGRFFFFFFGTKMIVLGSSSQGSSDIPRSTLSFDIFRNELVYALKLFFW